MSVVIVPTGQGTTITDAGYARSLPNSVESIVGNFQGMGVSTLRKEITTQDVYQLTDGDYDSGDDIYSGTFLGTYPSREWHWNIVFQSLNAASVSVSCAVTVEYLCELYDANNLPAS